MSVFCREYTRDLVQAVILDLVHSEEQAVEAPGSKFDQIVKFSHIKVDSIYSTSKNYSCDNNL
jgi:hypothetical protein